MTEPTTEATEAPVADATPDEPIADESSTDEAEPDTFPREVVEKLRQENGKYRQRAQQADTYATRLHTELVRATGRLADPTDLEFDEEHLELVPTLATRGIRIRAGIHVGECEKRGEEWSGMAVHVGARISAMAQADELLASRTVRDLSAGSGLRFESLGPRRLKGLPEEVDVYRVTTPTSGLTP